MSYPNIIENIISLEDEIQYIKSSYLPLSGGLITGPLSFSVGGNNNTIRVDSNESNLNLYGGTDYDTGSWLYLSGNNADNTWIESGSFVLRASNSNEDYSEIEGRKNRQFHFRNFDIHFDDGMNGILLEQENKSRITIGSIYDENGDLKDHMSRLIVTSPNDAEIPNRIYLRAGNGETQRELVIDANVDEYPIVFNSNITGDIGGGQLPIVCLLYTSPSPRDS